jgi:tRNA (guanine37-N1)-methyltransferase
VDAVVVTLFPGLFAPFLDASVLGRARAAGRVRIDLVDLRSHGEGAHRVVDDRPFGGGPGMVLMAEPVLRAVEEARAALALRHPGRDARTLLLTPQGRRFDQAEAARLAAAPGGFVLVCGRYEGIDERAVEILRPDEVSIGDFVLSGGEVAAMAVLDAAARLVPGVLGDERSPVEESFGEAGILDHPHYTRPVVVRGLEVPAVLRTGNHAEIARWRRERAVERTRRRRPDLLPADGSAEGAPCSPAS